MDNRQTMTQSSIDTRPPLARKVAYVLQRSNLSTNDVAARCGVSPQAVTNWKRIGKIKREHIAKLAAITGHSEDWWLNDAAPIDRQSSFSPQARRIAAALTARCVSPEVEHLLLAMIEALPPAAPQALPLEPVSDALVTRIATRDAFLRQLLGDPNG